MYFLGLAIAADYEVGQKMLKDRSFEVRITHFLLTYASLSIAALVVMLAMPKTFFGVWWFKRLKISNFTETLPLYPIMLSSWLLYKYFFSLLKKNL